MTFQLPMSPHVSYPYREVEFSFLKGVAPGEILTIVESLAHSPQNLTEVIRAALVMGVLDPAKFCSYASNIVQL